MFRIDDSSAALALPSPGTAGTEGYFTEGVPGSTAATLVRAAWLNMIQEELRNVIIAGGLAPSKTTYNQLLTALSAAGVFQTPATADNSTKAATTAYVQAQAYLPKSGGTMTGALGAAGTTGGIAAATGTSGNLIVQNAGTGATGTANAAFMGFNRNGTYGAFFGIDTDNTWKVGGWSAGAVSYSLLHSGNHTAFPGVCKAWINFDGTATAPTPRAQMNIASITKTATGRYTLAFTTAMTDANYVVAGSAGGAMVSPGDNNIVCVQSRSTTSCSVASWESSGGVGYEDTTNMNIIIFGN